MKCANCGTESSGRFCPSCGSQLQPSTCGQCGAELLPGAQFCTRCGARIGGAARGSGVRAGGSPNLPWYIAGGVLLVLILILAIPMLTGRDSAPSGTATFAPTAGTPPGTPPPLTGTPREQADRLFNRIMTAYGQGDRATVQQFTPMAIEAYRMAEPLDNDGLYHLASVHFAAGNYDVARSTADQILASEPNHLLGLFAAAQAADAVGDTAAARGFFERLLNAFETESARGLQEYLDHSRQLPELRAAARRYTES